MPAYPYYSSYAPSTSRHRVGEHSNSPATRRNRLERGYKRPIILSASTPDRKRTSAGNNTGPDCGYDLSTLPLLALSRVFFYLPSEDRIALSQTCRKLYQAESYSRQHRCRLNVRLDLMCSYKGVLREPNLATSMDVFGSMDLFPDSLRRSIENRPGAVCSMEKIACIDFSAPYNSCGKCDRKHWGGRMMITDLALRNVLGDQVVPSLVELHLHQCFISTTALHTIASIFVGLEILSVSLNGLECRNITSPSSQLDTRLMDTITNWPTLIKNKKYKQVLDSDSVKGMILFVYSVFPALETFLLYTD